VGDVLVEPSVTCSIAYVIYVQVWWRQTYPAFSPSIAIVDGFGGAVGNPVLHRLYIIHIPSIFFSL
jgi:hypothetical protein